MPTAYHFSLFLRPGRLIASARHRNGTPPQPILAVSELSLPVHRPPTKSSPSLPPFAPRNSRRAPSPLIYLQWKEQPVPTRPQTPPRNNSPPIPPTPPRPPRTPP